MMKSTKKSAMGVLAAIVGACLLTVVIGAAGGRKSAEAQSESVAESMRRLSVEMMDAYERRDPAALRGFYAKQPGALFFWERRMSYTWDEIDQTMGAIVGAVTKLKLTMSEFRSGGAGQTGWFAALFHIERTTADGRQSASDGRWTVVAEKINGRWQIVHEHTSFPLPKP